MLIRSKELLCNQPSVIQVFAYSNNVLSREKEEQCDRTSTKTLKVICHLKCHLSKLHLSFKNL